MVALRDRLRRWVVGLLARRRGEVRANQDFRFVGQVARLAGVFAVTMLLPIAFLALLSLTSIRSEELSLTADVEARSRARSDDLQRVLADVFSRFEGATSERLGAGVSPTDGLGELSPHLRAAFTFDAAGGNGRPTGPFLLGEERRPQRPAASWRSATRRARRLESTGVQEAALGAWREARSASRSPADLGEAALGEARSLAALGRAEEARRVLGDLYSDVATARDERGFQFGHLVRLEIASLGPPDDVAARTELEALVDDLLAAPWTLGEPGEPTVARHALALLEGRSDPEWLARRRGALLERFSQFSWAERVEDEVANVYSKIPTGEFRYLGARADSPGVWALIRTETGFHAFSFSVDALVGELTAAIQRSNLGDPDLVAHLEPLAAGSQVPNLGPWLPSLGVVVEPRDPEALARNVAWRRAVRLAIVVTAVFVAGVGAVWVARMVALEVESAHQRADFAANVSHELRSPITQIRLKGEALQLGLVDPGDDMQQHFDTIVREAERLSRLVDNVLDFASIERGTKSYQLRSEDLGAVVSASVEAARASLEQAGMDIELDLPPDPPWVNLDRDAMGQVLTNLLSNAAKYASEGRWVGVSVQVVRDGEVEVAVADRGMGIHPDELPRVFDDFFRSADPRVRRTKGTGIGLAIVRYIVEAHGGSISVSSTLGRGATFRVTLPTRGSSPPDEQF